MRYTLGRPPITASRGLSARTRAGIAGLAILGASVAGLALSGPANAVTNASATTTFQAHPDSGNHGNWAVDDFTRVATVTFVSVDSTLTDCGTAAKTCFIYAGTIADAGSFSGISGALSPQAGVTLTGNPSGPFKGGSDVKFFSSSDTASATGVPATVTGAGAVSTTNWVEQFFPAGTTFGTGPTLTDWSWAYSSPATCEMDLRHRLLAPLGITEDRYLGFDSQAADPARECDRAARSVCRVHLEHLWPDFAPKRRSVSIPERFRGLHRSIGVHSRPDRCFRQGRTDCGQSDQRRGKCGRRPGVSVASGRGRQKIAQGLRPGAFRHRWRIPV